MTKQEYKINGILITDYTDEGKRICEASKYNHTGFGDTVLEAIMDLEKKLKMKFIYLVKTAVDSLNGD